MVDEQNPATSRSPVTIGKGGSGVRMNRETPRTMARGALAILLATLAGAGCAPEPTPVKPAPAPGPVFGDVFWSEWGDGRGELAAYDLETPRYGALRRGTAVAIFVTETFSNTDRVKADPGRHPKRDEFPVLKLNLVQDFATGLYDYNLMTSAFVALTPVNGRASGAPTKLSFSTQEWCGHVWAQLLFDARYARFTAHSYFDGEADSAASLSMPADAQSEDALLAWARGFATPLVAPGDSATRMLVGSLRVARLTHAPLSVARARFVRAATPDRVTVPAGTFDADVARVQLDSGRTWTFWVERESPRRVLRWTCSDGEHAELLGSDRLEYWKLTAPGDESALARLGLRPRERRTP